MINSRKVNRNQKIKVYGPNGADRANGIKSIIVLTDGKTVKAVRCGDRGVPRLPVYRRRMEIGRLEAADLKTVLKEREKLFRILSADEDKILLRGTLAAYDALGVFLASPRGEEFYNLLRELSEIEQQRSMRSNIDTFFKVFLDDEVAAMELVGSITKKRDVIDRTLDSAWLKSLPVASGNGYLVQEFGGFYYVTKSGIVWRISEVNNSVLHKYHGLGILDRLLPLARRVKDRETLETVARAISRIKPEMALVIC